MKSVHLVLVAASLIAISACNSSSKKQQSSANHVKETHESENKPHDANPHWEYEGEAGPENWANLCPAYSTCTGERQSPIDLSSNISTESTVIIDRTYHCVEGVELLNNGHSIQANFTSQDPNILTVNNKAFTLKQFHFHCPSEHTMDGKAFDGEAHFVHVSDDGDISVVGVFLVAGSENEFFKNIIAHIPSKIGEKQLITEKICAENAFSKDDEYYIYEGSLTTPPCTEGVNWFVRKQTMEVSAEQIDALKAIMPAHNARPVQKLNNREFGTLDEE